MDQSTIARATEVWSTLSRRTARLFVAPGRVNLIGEHVDYHGGPVLPVALDRGVVVAAASRDDRRCRLASADFDGVAELELPRLEEAEGWVRYPAAVLRELRDRGMLDRGVDLAFAGSVPRGAGLSSSAAILVATTEALVRLGGQQLDATARAELAHAAENRHVGVPCGIMDQFASSLAVEGRALFLDCRDRSFRQVPVPTEQISLLLFDSGTRHELTDGGYRQRVEEGRRALQALRRRRPGLRDLAAATREEVDAIEELDDTARRRARHVVDEVARVHRAVEALEAGELELFGEQLFASHDSLRDLYEVSTPRLDRLAEACRGQDAVLGARLTGAGFGGCLLAVVRRGHEAAVIAEVGESFARHFETPRSWQVGFGRAPSEISVPLG